MHWTVQSLVRLYCSWSVVLLLLHFPIAVYSTKGISSKGDGPRKGDPIAFGWFRAFWLFSLLRVFWLMLSFEIIAEAFRMSFVCMSPYSFKVQLRAIGAGGGGGMECDLAHGAPSTHA